MNDVWAVTFSSLEGVKKILAAGDLKVKVLRCVVIDPNNQGVRLKVHWVLHGVPDDEVNTAFAPHGKLVDVSKEQWRVSGCFNKGSTTRGVTLKLKPGITG